MLGFIIVIALRRFGALCEVCLRSMFAKYVCEVCMFAKKVVVRVFAVGKVGYRKSLGSTRRSCIFNKVKKRNWR